MACVCWPLLASLGAIIYQLRLSKDHMPLSIACLRLLGALDESYDGSATSQSTRHINKVGWMIY
jgi:hypothetical protein